SLALTAQTKRGFRPGVEERFTAPEDRDTGASHDDVYFAPLLWRVPVESALVLLASLLHERRVVITGSHLSSVSSAVHAAAAMLYPLTWQHIFIPILPHALMDYLTAPMPFLIGLPEPLLPLLRSLPTEELVLLNLDTGEVEYFENDVSALPKKPRQKLEADLRQALHMVAHDDKVIARALLKFFVWIFGGYQPYVGTKLPQQKDGDGALPRLVASPSVAARAPALCAWRFRAAAGGETLLCAPGDSGQRQGERRCSVRQATTSRGETDMGLQHEGLWFDHQAFVDSHTSSTTRAFLQYCRQTQMYEAFVRERLQLKTAGSPHGDAFERSALLRTQTMTNKLESELGQKMVKMKGVKKKLSRSSSKIMSQSKAAAEQKVRKIMKRMSGVYNNPGSTFQTYVPNPMMGSAARPGSSQHVDEGHTLSSSAPTQDNTTESDSDTEQEPQLWTSFSTAVPERPGEPHERPSMSPSVTDEPSPSSESAMFSGFEDLCLMEGPPPAKYPAPIEFMPCPSSCPDPFADSFTDPSWQPPLPSAGKSAPIDHSLVSQGIQHSPAGAVQDAGDMLACALGMQSASSGSPATPEPPPLIDLLS
ncbi:hypothetical protein CYMTET_23797, partial [Cymbomonas tetramitiformis]